MNEKKTMTVNIITHNGSFHCDEVLAFAFIRYLHDGNVLLTRTRDMAVIDGTPDSYVIDVGGVYNHSSRRYDHHQGSFNETYDERSTIPLSSAGLIYKHYADEILKKYVGGVHPDTSVNIPQLKDKVYDMWIKHIDANDTGIGICAGSTRFSISSAIYARVGRMNLRWNQPADPYLEEEAFLRATSMVFAEFTDIVDSIIIDHFMSESVVRESIISNTFDDILVLKMHCPWKGHISRLEKEYEKRYTFIVYPEDKQLSGSPTGKWRVHAIPVANFENRMVIPSHLSTVPGVTFIHKAGFIAACTSYSAALNLAKVTIGYMNGSSDL